MNDLVVRHGLETMARDAAKRFRELIANGEEIPYEVREPGAGTPLCRYEPLTERFVRDHAGELRELDSFGATCAALEASELAGDYLDQMGITPPEDPRRRAELAGIAFLCRLWMGSSDFSLDSERLAAATAELEDSGELEVGELEVAVPLRGFQMPVSRLAIGPVTIFAADAVEVPAEARAGDGLGASPWEPIFLAVVRIPEPGEDELEGAAPAVGALRRLVTTLRLFKSGGVALGPHAWTHVPGDRWRRIATGSGKPRPGGYRLVEAELAPLVAFARSLSGPSTPFGRSAAARPGLPVALARAISRFEAGLERISLVEGLNDNLLALRFLLEGSGPAGLGLAMRVAGLCAEPPQREEVKAVVDRAIGLERELWSGEPAPGAGTSTPAETAALLEELTRAILKDAACGHLGGDLRVTADEILLADGLAIGEGRAEQRGATAEWRVDDEAPDESAERTVAVEGSDASQAPDGESELADELDAIAETLDRGEAGSPDPEPQGELWARFDDVEVSVSAARTGPEPSPEPEEEENLIARARREPRPIADEPVTQTLEAIDGAGERESGAPTQSPVLRLIEQTRAERKVHHDRIAGLFPKPETTEWSVREVAYDRNRRADVP